MNYELNCESSSVDRALAFQAEGRGFESRLSLLKKEMLTRLASLFVLAFSIEHRAKSREQRQKIVLHETRNTERGTQNLSNLSNSSNPSNFS